MTRLFSYGFTNYYIPILSVFDDLPGDIKTEIKNLDRIKIEGKQLDE
jgi:hypothetical protein